MPHNDEQRLRALCALNKLVNAQRTHGITQLRICSRVLRELSRKQRQSRDSPGYRGWDNALTVKSCFHKLVTRSLRPEFRDAGHRALYHYGSVVLDPTAFQDSTYMAKLKYQKNLAEVLEDYRTKSPKDIGIIRHQPPNYVSPPSSPDPSPPSSPDMSLSNLLQITYPGTADDGEVRPDYEVEASVAKGPHIEDSPSPDDPNDHDYGHDIPSLPRRSDVRKTVKLRITKPSAQPASPKGATSNAHAAKSLPSLTKSGSKQSRGTEGKWAYSSGSHQTSGKASLENPGSQATNTSSGTRVAKRRRKDSGASTITISSPAQGAVAISGSVQLNHSESATTLGQSHGTSFEIRPPQVSHYYEAKEGLPHQQAAPNTKAATLWSAVVHRMQDFASDHGIGDRDAMTAIEEITAGSTESIALLFDAAQPIATAGAWEAAEIIVTHCPELGEVVFGFGGKGPRLEVERIRDHIAAKNVKLITLCRALLAAFWTKEILQSAFSADLTTKTSQQVFHEAVLERQSPLLLELNNKLIRHSNGEYVTSADFRQSKIVPAAKGAVELFESKMAKLFQYLFKDIREEVRQRWQECLQSTFENCYLLKCMMHLGDERYYFTLPPSGCQFCSDSMYNENYPPIESTSPEAKRSTARKLTGNTTKSPRNTNKSKGDTQQPTISVALSPMVYVVRKRARRGNAGNTGAGTGGSGSGEVNEEKVLTKAYVKLN